MQKRFMFGTCAAAMMSVALVGAQSGSTTPETRTGSQTSTPGASAQGTNRVTVTGCVMRGSGANEYTLTGMSASNTDNAQSAGAVSGSNTTGRDSVGTSGTSATRSYVLMGTPSQNLGQYVGSGRVEIVATTMSNTGSSSSGAAIGTSGTGSGTAGENSSTASGNNRATATGNSSPTAGGNSTGTNAGTTTGTASSGTGNTRDTQSTAIATDPASTQNNSTGATPSAGSRAGSTSTGASASQTLGVPEHITVVSVRRVAGNCP